MNYFDRIKLIDIMHKYGMGNKLINIISSYWKFQISVVKKGKFYGPYFIPTRGVTQGDIIYPIIFNIIVDSVINIIHKKITDNKFIRIH